MKEKGTGNLAIAAIILIVVIAGIVVIFVLKGGEGGPVPATFEVSNLAINPSEAEAGNSVEISVTVTNTGDLQGTHTVSLKINEDVEATREVTLAGGATETVSFTVTKDTPGTYTVGVNGLVAVINWVSKKDVIIDTDLAADDVIAIMYLLKHPDVRIHAITVSCGEAHVDVGARNMLRLLDYLGFPDVPVAAGRATPLQVDHTFPSDWRAWVDNFFNLYLPSTDLEPSNMSASELIISIAKSSTKRITLLTLGPLTNVAMALQSDPSIKDNIEEIFMMGGAVKVPGNLRAGYPTTPNEKAEFNIWIDPHAAEIVFKSGIPITQIPLDATNKVPVTSDFYNKVGREKRTPEAEIAFSLLKVGLGFYLWDELAAVTLTDQSIVSLEEHHIEVVTTDVVENIGWTKSIQGKPANAKVAVDADASKFENILLGVINT